MASREGRESDMSNSPAHILIVEDEGDVREALLAQLQIEGHQVVEARSGSDALELVSQQSFDVVLTDVQMPGLNGIELLKRIAPMPSAPATIVMTGYGSVSMGIEAMKGGAHDFLEKPFSGEILLATVASALRMKRLRDENVELRRTVQGQFECIKSLKPVREVMHSNWCPSSPLMWC